MLRYLPLMFKNALRNKRRSLLTIASIAVSLCVLGLLMALYRGLFLSGPATPAQALRLVVHHRVSMTQPVPMAYLDKIRQINPKVLPAGASQVPIDLSNVRTFSTNARNICRLLLKCLLATSAFCVRIALTSRPT